MSTRKVLFAIFYLIAPAAYADVNSSVTWLTAQQSADGSWGAPAVAFGDTQEAIDALRLSEGPNPVYYRGIAWLENHDPANNDGQSRKLGALTDRGDPTAGALGSLAADSTPSTLAYAASGWGLGGSLEASPYDTALVLRALSKQSPEPNVAGAIAYLEATQLPGSGWELVPGGGLDITTTAQVIRSLYMFQSQDPNLPGVLSQATSALMGAVTSSTSIKEQSLALIVATLETPGAPQIAQLQSVVKGAQQSDGSWGDDPFATAIAMQALAISGSNNSAYEYTVVNIPDPALRAAINAALGHDAGDAITIGDLEQLTSLNLSNLGVTNLTGLQYATNLTSLVTTGDNITTPEPPHLPPVANNDVAILRGRRLPLSISPTANDTDPNGLSLIISTLSQPSHGQVVLLSDRVTVLYTPDPEFTGTDTFTYTITDGTGGFSSATVTVDVRRYTFPYKYLPAIGN